MARRKPPPRVRDGDVTRARIETEALRLFAAKGVDGTTVRDLSLAVGVADAALYRYFVSKEEIARVIFTRHYAALAAEIKGMGLSAAIAFAAGGKFDGEPAITKAGPPGADRSMSEV